MEYPTATIKKFLGENYRLPIKEIRKIDRGVLNSNYLCQAADGKKYVFRIYNFKRKKEVSFETDILQYLIKNKFPCPALILSCRKETIVIFGGRPCVVYEFIEGENPKKMTPELLFQIGLIEARLHKILKDLRPRVKKPTWDPEELKLLVARKGRKLIRAGFPGAKELIDFVQRELKKYIFPLALPQGITHQDIKPENIIVQNGEIKGIVDFDNSYVGALVHDITTTIIWSCFTEHQLNKNLLDVLLSGYEKERQLTELEKEYLHPGIKFRLVREVFIGPFVTTHLPELSRERADYFIDLYKNLNI